MIRYIKSTTAVIALLSATALAAPHGAAEPQGGADLVIRGGTIYTGDAAPFRGDVAIRGDRIVYVGPKAPGTAAKTASISDSGETLFASASYVRTKRWRSTA